MMDIGLSLLLLSVLVGYQGILGAPGPDTTPRFKYGQEQDHRDVSGRLNLGRDTAVLEDQSYWNKVCQDDLVAQLAKSPIVKQAKNIIFFLGDGTSITTMTAARIHKGSFTGNYEHEVLEWEKFPYSTLIKTYSGDKQVTDSAASSTAYLSGAKGNQATIGVDVRVPLGDCAAMNIPQFHTKSILTNFQEAGRSTGIVTTTRVTHASPAGTYAHTCERHWESDDDINDVNGDPVACDDIAEQLILGPTGSNIKVILGGGRRSFTPKGIIDPEGGDGSRRDDGKNLIETWQTQKALLGRSSYVWQRSDLLNLDTSNLDYLLGLFDWSHMSWAIDKDISNPSLKEMTETAIQVLQNDPNGYFLFVEGGKIDMAHHLSEARSALTETIEFEKAVKAAVDLTDEQDTLIIVTADHSQPLVMNGYAQRGSDITGLGDISDVDNLPYTTLLYANGPGYRGEVNGVRLDPSLENIADPHYMNDATVPMIESNHAGEDVVLFARGPHAHLFTGSHENAYIPHALRYAACVGDGLKFCP